MGSSMLRVVGSILIPLLATAIAPSRALATTASPPGAGSTTFGFASGTSGVATGSTESAAATGPLADWFTGSPASPAPLSPIELAALSPGAAASAGLAPAVLAPAVLATADRAQRAPGLVFLASLILPGTGQLLNGDRRGYLYLAADASAWFARASYLDASRTKEGEAEEYARRHWSYERFGGTTGEDGCLYTAAADSALSQFAAEDLEAYYEAIGRQDAYRCGWDDFRAGYDPLDPNASSRHRIAYRDQLSRADDLSDKASLALTAAVLNRIVSGVDAFMTARRRRMGHGADGALQIRSELRRRSGETQTTLALSYPLR